MEFQQDSNVTRSDQMPIMTNVELAGADEMRSSLPHRQRPVITESIPDRLGSIVGNRYVLQSRMGSGRLGIVYEAVDLQLSKAGRAKHCVNIELLRLSGDRKDVSARFANEFLNLLSLPHPNIARIIDFGYECNTIFFTTEALEGASLRSILDSTSTDSFSENEVLAVLAGIADALCFAHGKGFVHGNITAESIFITSDYEVKITDLAPVVLEQNIGNFTEQRFGGRQSPQRAADVFGLAALAYELLSGKPPFGGLSRAQARPRGHELQRIKGIPRHQWKALSRALETRSGAHKPSIAEFVAEFGVAGDETLVESESAHVAKRPRVIRPLLWLVAIAAAVGLIQTNVETLRDLFTDLRGSTGAALVTAVPSKSLADDSVSTRPAESEAQEIVPENPSLTDSAVAAPAPAEVLVTEKPVAKEATAGQIEEIEILPAAPVTTPGSDSTARIGQAADASPELSSPENGSEPGTDATSISFDQDIVTAYESQNMAPIVIQRRGMVDVETSIFWWTGDNTAIADLDYAELGVRTETFSAGQDDMTVYVPLVSDSVRENRESFFVFLGTDLATKSSADRLEVVVIDND